jgi:hypothetical protein
MNNLSANNQRSGTGRVFDIILIALGLLSLGFAHFGWQFVAQSGWPSTKARIDSALVEDASAAGRTFNSHLKIIYSYSVKGKEFRTEEVAVPFLKYQDQPKYSEQFARGSFVEIHYNPDLPADSQLASVSKNSKLFLLLSAVLAIIVLLGVFCRKRVAEFDAFGESSNYA